MNPEASVLLNLGQVVMLGGLIWGLARMSKTVDVHSAAMTNLTQTLEKLGAALNHIEGRVGILEDRSYGRRRADQGEQ